MATLNCTKILKGYYRLANYITPVRSSAIMILSLGLLDNLTSSLQHAVGGGTLIYVQTPIEWIIRIVFIFCGVFGLLGSEIVKRLRATVVALPLLYLFVFYLMMLFKYNNFIFTAFIILTGIPGIWLLLFGDNYD